MDFYVVYKLGDEGGKFGCTYFMSIEEAHKYYSSWRERKSLGVRFCSITNARRTNYVDCLSKRQRRDRLGT